MNREELVVSIPVEVSFREVCERALAQPSFGDLSETTYFQYRGVLRRLGLAYDLEGPAWDYSKGAIMEWIDTLFEARSTRAQARALFNRVFKEINKGVILETMLTARKLEIEEAVDQYLRMN